MEDIPQIVPQEGKLGMTVDDLVFHKHEMAYGAEILEDTLTNMPSSTQKAMASWISVLKSTKHAVVEFPNGSGISIITGIPAQEGNRPSFGFGSITFARGDLRVPTYEVSISIPGNVKSDVRAYQTSDQVNEILAKLASRPG